MEKKNKKKKRIATGLVVTALVAGCGGVLAYKKCPKFNKAVNKGLSFILDSFKGPEPKKIFVKTKPLGVKREYINFKKN